MNAEALPSDIDPQSRCRLPLPDPGALDDASRRTYESLADPDGGSLAGLQGPGGIRLHSPALSNGLRPVNLHLRQPDVIDARTRELAILVTAREHDCQFEWYAHEAEAIKQGVAPDIVDIVRHRRPTDGLDAADAALIDFGRELYCDHRVTPETYARFAAGYDRRTLVDLVNLMGMYAMTATVLIAFDAQLPEGAEPGLRDV
ncbi:MAG: carboxymuconolactone decarboxylase family protein [Alphaproteobacteria bacterium]